MKIAIYYDKRGKSHKIRVRYSFGRYVIYLDDAYYAAVDERNEVDEAVQELVTYKHYSATKPSKRKSAKEVTA